jgi:pilus assembly protein Flp/PilA
MLQKMMRFIRDEEGATAVEYGLIIGLIAVLLVAVLTAIGGTSTTGLQGLFTKVQTALANAIAAS